jgi:hypothetical protein
MMLETLRVGGDCMNDVCVCDTLVASRNIPSSMIRQCVPVSLDFQTEGFIPIPSGVRYVLCIYCNPCLRRCCSSWS